MTKWQKTPERKREVGLRAAQPDHLHRFCRAFPCGEPARAGTGDGLDRRYCRRHADHYQRHGSPFKGSYTAAQIEPHRMRVHRWLKANAGEFLVQAAVQRVRSLYEAAGPVREATSLRGLTPRERARMAWARLRRAGVDPLRPVEAWLTIELTIAADPQPVSKREFKQVQAAKLVHRMASGTHKRWPPIVIPHPTDPYRTISRPQELHAYPRSRGRVLWHIGADLEEAAGIVVDLAKQQLAQEASRCTGVQVEPKPRRRRKMPAPTTVAPRAHNAGPPRGGTIVEEGGARYVETDLGNGMIARTRIG